MKKLFSFVIGFIYGAAVGAAGALLFTPMSGPDLRGEMNSRYQTVLQEGRNATAARRAELEKQLADLKHPRS